MIVTKYDWNTQQDVPYVVDGSIAEEFFNWLLTTRKWELDRELLMGRFRVTRNKLFATAQPVPAPEAPTPAPVPPAKPQGKRALASRA